MELKSIEITFLGRTVLPQSKVVDVVDVSERSTKVAATSLISNC
jgi:hypothetical protein